MSRGETRQSRVHREEKLRKRPLSWPAKRIGTSAKEKAQIMTENATDYSIGCTIAEHEGLQQKNVTGPRRNLTAGFSGPFETKLQQIIEGIGTTAFPRAEKTQNAIKRKDEKRMQRREATIRQGHMDAKRDLARAKVSYKEHRSGLSFERISLICAGNPNPIGDRCAGKIDFMKNLNLTPVEFHRKIVKKVVEACGFYQCRPEKDPFCCQQKAHAKVISCAPRTRRGTIYSNNNLSPLSINTAEPK